MKKVFVFILSLCTALAVTSCGKDSPEQAAPELFKTDTSSSEYEIIEESDYTAEELADRILGPKGSNAGEDAWKEELREAFLKKDHERKEALEEKLGTNGLATNYHSVRYTYWSVDAFDKPIKLSGTVTWGQFWCFDYFDLDPDWVCLVPHYTICSEEEAPYEFNAVELMAIAGDNLIFMPDYIGYGVTKDKTHPYLMQDLCARNCIDALDPGYKLFKDKSDGSLEDDWKFYIAGCSQGGGVALACHKYMDTHLDYAKSWRFQYSYCGSGPYVPVITMDKYLEQGYVSYPCVIPMVLNSMYESYPEILGKYKKEDFYSKKYTTIPVEFIMGIKYDSYMDMMDSRIAAKVYDADEINNNLFSIFYDEGGKDEKIRLNAFLSPEMLDRNSQICKDFYKCLEKNDLTKGWTPSHKIKLFHGKEDDIVAYDNAKAVQDTFPGDKVTLQYSPIYPGHISACVSFILDLATNNW